jgi:hypothetical protein
MSPKKSLKKKAVALLAAAGMAATGVAAAAPAQAAGHSTSLFDVLAADLKNGKPSFDTKGTDFDILTAAALAVLGEKPDSPVGLLADPSFKLTAFIPTDNGFKRTAEDLGLHIRNEKALANALVATLGIDGIEQVLLYHVVPGVKITKAQALKADGAKLPTALGPTIEVDVRKTGAIVLKDAAKPFPRVTIPNINRSPANQQIAHGIGRVLLP